MKIRIIVSLVAATAATALLAGCGPKATDNSANSGTNGSGGKSASCDLAPASLIKQTLGMDVTAPTADTNDSVLVCTYSPAGGASGTVILRFDTASSAQQYKTTRDGYATQNMTTTDYPGFGDEAYTSSISALNITTNTLDARKGAVEMQVSSHASFDQERALLQKLFDALS